MLLKYITTCNVSQASFPKKKYNLLNPKNNETVEAFIIWPHLYWRKAHLYFTKTAHEKDVFLWLQQKNKKTCCFWEATVQWAKVDENWDIIKHLKNKLRTFFQSRLSLTSFYLIFSLIYLEIETIISWIEPKL